MPSSRSAPVARPRPADNPAAPIFADEVDLSPIDTHLGFLLRLAQQSLFDEFHRAVGEDGWTPARYSVLALVAARPGLRQVTVANALRIKPPNFAVLINAMQADGLIERQTSEGNRRERRLVLTSIGQAAHRRLEPRVLGVEAAFAKRLSPEVLEILITALGKLQTG